MNKNFPTTIPSIAIRKLDKESTPVVVCNEIRNWFTEAKLGESSAFAIYDTLVGKRLCSVEVVATNKATVHDIPGVELATTIFIDGGDTKQGQIVAQLTETNCNFLAYFDSDGDVKRYRTFYDDALDEYDVNENGCETHIRPESYIERDDDGNYIVDFSVKTRSIVGSFEVNINGKSFETVCAVVADIKDTRTLIEQYIDSNGRTILQREFMADSMMEVNGIRIGLKSENYPYVITINGSKHVCTAVVVTELAL